MKPGNIFVSKDGTKVLDFGIARVTNQAAGADFDAGSLGALTPAYASLEMIEGEEPHPSDDVYAAAIIAYELFTGKHPYDRKPADQALREKLRPTPVRSLNKHQWQTLAAGLKLRRAERLQDITRFYRGLTQKQRSIKGLLLGTVVGSALLATAAARWFLTDDRLESRIGETYRKGELCLQQGDAPCAIDGAKAVLQLAPEHAAAQALLTDAQAALLRQRETDLLAAFDACLTQRADLDCARRNLQSLTEVSAASAHLIGMQQRLADAIRQVDHQQRLLQAQTCLAQADFACAIANAETVLAEGGASADSAAAVRAEATRQQQQQQQARAERAQAFNADMAAAEACLRQKDYACAHARATAAQASDTNPAQAQNLVQKIEFARSEYQGNLQKAQNVLAKGRTCFEKKNYSCAIANSESALEFLPGYRPALQLRREAQEAVELLKKQIIIE